MMREPVWVVPDGLWERVEPLLPRREQAEIGVLLSMQEPTGPMRAEAASAGYYHSPGWGTSHPRVQLISIAEALAGKQIDYPHHTATTFNVAPKQEDDGPPQEEQLFEV